MSFGLACSRPGVVRKNGKVLGTIGDATSTGVERSLLPVQSSEKGLEENQAKSAHWYAN
jgi:hypothetical protein